MAKPTLTVTTGTSGLRIEHLRKSFRKKLVIRDVTMTLDRGEVVALLGPNGSGKTTCFYTIAGLVFPEAGRVTIDGRGNVPADVSPGPPWHRLFATGNVDIPGA